MPRTNALVAEVTHISKHGFWLLLGDAEHCVPFSKCPWFRSVTVDQICDFERPTPDHLYWPRLEVVLSAFPSYRQCRLTLRSRRTPRRQAAHAPELLR